MFGEICKLCEISWWFSEDGDFWGDGDDYDYDDDEEEKRKGKEELYD